MMTFDHLAIFVADVERSAAFYEQVFGLQRIPEPFHDGFHLWLEIGPGTSLHIVGNAAEAKAREITHHMAFRISDLDAFMARLETLGVVYRSFRGDAKVAARRDGVRQVYFQDRDNYWIEVNEAKAT
jgi:lactoylglutathione lyase